MSDAFYIFNKIYEMFETLYSMPLLKYRTVIFTHTGNKDDASYNMDGWFHTLRFGDGAKYFYPLVGVGMLAHEVGHAFSTEHSDLAYEGQSGGLAEAFSDMTGEITDWFISQEPVDWMLGAKVNLT